MATRVRRPGIGKLKYVPCSLTQSRPVVLRSKAQPSLPATAPGPQAWQRHTSRRSISSWTCFFPNGCDHTSSQKLPLLQPKVDVLRWNRLTRAVRGRMEHWNVGGGQLKMARGSDCGTERTSMGCISAWSTTVGGRPVSVTGTAAQATSRSLFRTTIRLWPPVQR